MAQALLTNKNKYRAPHSQNSAEKGFYGVYTRFIWSLWLQVVQVCVAHI